jgi:1,3-propanediol dehydrogenase/alcohol dehydrogenase
MQFNLHFPGSLMFGNDSVEKLGEAAKEYGNRCLIVTGKSSTKSGVLDRTVKSLEKMNIGYSVFDRVGGEPDCDIVDDVREVAEQEEVQFIIGLGGGSPLDVAKAAAGLWGQELDTIKYLNKEPFEYKGIPFVAIPTTAGTGSEITLNSVFYNPVSGNKKSLAHPHFQARLAIVDATLTYSMSPRLTAFTGMDALTHAVESYTSLKANMVTRTLAAKAVELVINNIMNAIEDGTHKKARSNMALGSMMAGLAFAQTGVGAAHSISHPLGANFHIPHGVACALLLPAVIDFNSKDCRDKYEELEKMLGIDKPLSSYLRELIKKMPIPQSLTEAGYNKEREDIVVASTFDSRSIENNPRKVEKKDVIEILEKCL